MSFTPLSKRYSGGNQMDSIRMMFGLLTSNISVDGPPPPILFAADSRRSKLPLEPKGFPYQDERTTLFKSVHIFALFSCSENYEFTIRTVRKVPWLRIVRNGTVVRDEQAKVQLLHYTMEYDYKQVVKTERDPVEVVVGFCAKVDQGAQQQQHRRAANVMPWPLATTAFSFIPIAPNSTHQRNRVAPDHFLCRDPEVLVANLEERSFTRKSIKDTYGLHFLPRTYGPKNSGASSQSSTAAGREAQRALAKRSPPRMDTASSLGGAPSLAAMAGPPPKGAPLRRHCIHSVCAPFPEPVSSPHQGRLHGVFQIRSGPYPRPIRPSHADDLGPKARLPGGGTSGVTGGGAVGAPKERRLMDLASAVSGFT